MGRRYEARRHDSLLIEQLIAVNPTISAGRRVLLARTESEVAAWLQERSPSLADPWDARLVAATLLTAHHVAVLRWVSEPGASLAELSTEYLMRLAERMPPPETPPPETPPREP